MKTQNVSIVSIHPDPAKPLELDVKHILAALGPHLQQWTWCVRNLDWLGENAEAICKRVEAAAPKGLRITSPELLEAARGVYQTIEGEFIAFPRDLDALEVDLQGGVGSFPTSKADFAIVAVDGSFFVIYAKDPDILVSLRGIGDIREEDVSLYS